MPLLVTAYEFGVCSTLSMVYLTVMGRGGARAPVWPLVRISILVFSSLVSGNIALRWVSFPVKVIIKSCKLLPTMALGSLILSKAYSVWDHVAAVLLCCGLVGFTLASSDAPADGDTPPEKSTSLIGIALLFFAVCCDAVQVLMQERLVKAEPRLTPMHIMVYTNGLAFVAVAGGILVTGEASIIPEGLPWGRLLMYGGTSWIGVCCFIALARSHGGTGAVVATNSRKLISIILSFWVFPKPLTPTMLLSGVCVCAGVAVHAYRKARGHTRTPHVKRRSE
jgi:adenosine 3'-phospho 5'-phosphosulfate transporter B3